MRKDTLEFANEKYFNGHSDTRSVQENFDLLTSFIQDLADKISHRNLAGRSLQFLGIMETSPYKSNPRFAPNI